MGHAKQIEAKTRDPYNRTDQKYRVERKEHGITSTDIGVGYLMFCHFNGCICFQSYGSAMKKYTDFRTSITALKYEYKVIEI